MTVSMTKDVKELVWQFFKYYFNMEFRLVTVNLIG